MKKRIFTAVASILMICSILVSLCGCGSFNYMTEDLTKYIEISEEAYKNYTLKIKFDDIGEADVERRIMKLLCQNKNKTPEYNGGNVTNLPISVGDVAHIYYRGYTVDENGVETDMKNASNLLDSLHALEIGSGSFISGFEEGLIGKNPKDYARFELINSGNVEAGDVIYLTYNAMMPDGSTRAAKSERIDLSKEYIDSIYGKGFTEFFVNARIGEKISQSAVFEVDGGSAVYYDITVDYKTNCERAPLTIDVHFPMDYSEEGLRAVDAKFDVYVRYVNIYKAPSYDEEFIKNTLKITEEDLSNYPGDTLLEKHRQLLLEEARTENEEKRKALIEEAMWNYYNSKVVIKKLPKEEVDTIYQEYYNETVLTYQTYYSTAYDSVASFARVYYGLSSGVDWLDYITERAERVVVEKMIFYYIIRKENFIPEKELFDSMYDEVVEEYFEYYKEDIYKTELEAIKDESALQKRLAEIKAEMLDYYGEDYFTEMVYYDYALEKIMAFATITE